MWQPLPYGEIIFDRNVELEDFVNTPGKSDIGFLIAVDIIYPDEIKEKTKSFPFCPKNKCTDSNNFCVLMKEIKPNDYTKYKKLVCD